MFGMKPNKSLFKNRERQLQTKKVYSKTSFIEPTFNCSVEKMLRERGVFKTHDYFSKI